MSRKRRFVLVTLTLLTLLVGCYAVYILFWEPIRFWLIIESTKMPDWLRSIIWRWL